MSGTVWEKRVRTWFAGCYCWCSFWSSSGWPPSRPHKESWRLLLSSSALACHKHSPKQSSVWSQKFQESYLFIVYIYKHLSMKISHYEFFRATIQQSKAVWSTTKDFSLGCCWQLAENWYFRPQPIQVISSILVTDPKWSRCINFVGKTILIATGPNVLESLLLITMIITSLPYSMWLWHSG